MFVQFVSTFSANRCTKNFRLSLPQTRSFKEQCLVISDGNCVDQGTPMSMNAVEGFIDHQRTSPGVRHRLHNTGKPTARVC